MSRPVTPPPPRVRQGSVSRLVRLSVIIGIVGLVCVLLFLWQGFRSWTVGVGIFFGMPLLLLSMLIYVVAVLRDLSRKEVFAEPPPRTPPTR